MHLQCSISPGQKSAGSSNSSSNRTPFHFQHVEGIFNPHSIPCFTTLQRTHSSGLDPHPPPRPGPWSCVTFPTIQGGEHPPIFLPLVMNAFRSGLDDLGVCTIVTPHPPPWAGAKALKQGFGFSTPPQRWWWNTERVQRQLRRPPPPLCLPAKRGAPICGTICTLWAARSFLCITGCTSLYSLRFVSVYYRLHFLVKPQVCFCVLQAALSCKASGVWFGLVLLFCPLSPRVHGEIHNKQYPHTCGLAAVSHFSANSCQVNSHCS